MYSVCILRQAIKDVANLPKDYARLVSQHIDRLEENPRPSDSKRLREMTYYTLRVGVYRILYDIDDKTHTVTVYRIKHRYDVYR